MNMNVSKTNTGKLLATVMVLAMVFAGVAVLFSEDSVAATNTQNYSGVVDGPQTLNNNVIINDELTVTKGGVLTIAGNLTINDKVEVTIEKGGVIVVQPTGGKALVTINGNVEITGNGDTNPNVTGVTAVDGKYPSALVINGAAVTEGEISTFKDSGVVINGTVSVLKGGLITGGSNGGEILVKNNGTLNVDGKASTISNLDVEIAVGGTFNLAGIVGADGMTVSSYGIGDKFTLASASIATTSGATKTDDEVSDLTFTVSSSNVNGYLAAEEPTAVLIKEYALNIDGTVANLDVMTLSGGLYTKDTTGDVKYVPYAGQPYYTSSDAAKHADSISAAADADKAFAYNDLVMGKAIIENLVIDTTASLEIGAEDSGNAVPVYVLVNGTLTVRETTEKDMADAGNGDGTDDKDPVPVVTIGDDSVIEIVGTVTTNYGSIADGTPGKLGTVAINGGTLTMEDFGDAVKCHFFGAYYVDKDGTAHVSDLTTAISAAVAAGEKEVVVYAANNSEKDEKGYGGYAITADLTIPDNITLIVNNALVVDSNVKVTISADAEVEINDTWGKIFINGTVEDLSGDLGSYEGDNTASPAFEYMYFQVKLVDEDAEVSTYTSLENALAIATSGTIYLYNDVDVTGTLTIPTNVTVQFATDVDAAKTITVTETGTLVIDGTLSLDANGRLTVETDGAVYVNNVLVSEESIVAGTNFTTIYGVYFAADLDDDGTSENYITSAAYAAANSNLVSTTMTVYGKVAMGAVTFTQGEDNQLTVAIKNSYDGVNDKNVATGNVTIAGAGFDTSAGAFTGTVTDGTNTLEFTKSMGVIIGFVTTETADGTSIDMILTGTDVLGAVGVTAGEVTIDSEMKFSNVKDTVGTLAVASGATLNIDKPVTLSASADDLNTSDLPDDLVAFIGENVNFDVAGTVNVNNGGALKWGYSVITGTLNVNKGGSLDLTLVQNNGTINVDSSVTYASAAAEVMVLNGAIVGNFGINELVDNRVGGAILVMPGADISGAKIMWDTTNDETQAQVSEIYINGELYATVYATDGDMPVQYIVETASVQGVDKTKEIKYYTDAAMDNQVTDLAKAFVGTAPAYYVSMTIAEASGTITQGTGLNLYIDNVALGSYTPVDGKYNLTVGTHTVFFDVKAGYDGANATITFNGQTVENGGPITITVDMMKDGFTLVANGAVPMDYAGGSSDDGMGLTEILLVILVILIVVMAIMVALRLMRS